MAYFQEIVEDYIRDTERSTFVRSECTVTLHPGKEIRGEYWICDALAVNFSRKSVYLCEVTYAKTLQALVRRLRAWDNAWPELRLAILRDFSVPDDWKVLPRVFIPKELHATLDKKFKGEQRLRNMPTPQVEYLGDIVPWLNKKSETRALQDISDEELKELQDRTDAEMARHWPSEQDLWNEIEALNDPSPKK